MMKLKIQHPLILIFFFQEDGPCSFAIGAGDDIPVTFNNEDDAVEPLSVADVQYLMQQIELAYHEIEMSESENESEYERKFDHMDYGKVPIMMMVQIQIRTPNDCKSKWGPSPGAHQGVQGGAQVQGHNPTGTNKVLGNIEELSMSL